MSAAAELIESARANHQENDAATDIDRSKESSACTHSQRRRFIVESFLLRCPFISSDGVAAVDRAPAD
jgi:hypothetical protein